MWGEIDEHVGVWRVAHGIRCAGRLPAGSASRNPSIADQVGPENVTTSNGMARARRLEARGRPMGVMQRLIHVRRRRSLRRSPGHADPSSSALAVKGVGKASTVGGQAGERGNQRARLVNRGRARRQRVCRYAAVRVDCKDRTARLFCYLCSKPEAGARPRWRLNQSRMRTFTSTRSLGSVGPWPERG